jgi:hypothetical protein
VAHEQADDFVSGRLQKMGCDAAIDPSRHCQHDTRHNERPVANAAQGRQSGEKICDGNPRKTTALESQDGEFGPTG